MKQSAGEKGFTLIELLVVITIITTLAAVVLGNLWSAQGKSIDAKRQADVDQMGVAVRLYYERYGEFPDYDQDIGVGNAIDDVLDPFIQVAVDPASPDVNYHYNSSENCPLAGGSDTVVIYATLSNEEKGNWTEICDSSGPAERYGIIIN